MTKPDNVDGEAPRLSPQSITAEGHSNVDDQSAGSPQFKDRRTGLFVFGVLQIVMGCCGLLIPLTLLPLFVGPATGAPTSVRIMIPEIGLYALLAVLLVWLGVGSILARRWARALTLVLAWMWIVIGIWP